MSGAISRWLLPASLTINVFLSATLLSMTWRDADYGHPPPPPPPPGFGPGGPGGAGGPPSPARFLEEITQALPAADAAVLRAAFEPRLEALAELDRNRHATPHKLREALSASTVDPAQISRIFADARAAHIGFESALEAGLLEAAPKLSLEGRRKLLEWRPPHRPPPR